MFLCQMSDDWKRNISKYSIIRYNCCAEEIFGGRMRFLPLFLLIGCSVGLVNETKPITAETGLADTAEENVDTGDTDEDTNTDTETNTQPTSENPNAGECADGIDNDGDGRTDCDDSDCVSAQNCQESNPQDADGDGYPDSQDCDPYNEWINPGAQEIPDNGLDDDCDGVTDNGSSSDTGGNTDTGGNNNPGPGTVCSDTCVADINNLYQASANDGTCQDGGFDDASALLLGVSGCAFGTDCTDCGVRVDVDGDGHMPDPSGLGLPLALYFDCDDNNPNVNASATEIPGNGVDEDCDGSDGSGSSGPSTETSCTDGSDNDSDGDIDCADSDCSSDPACSSGGCPSGQVLDCDGACANSSYLGDNICDDGITFSSNFNCAQFNYDDGDCIAVSVEFNCTDGSDNDSDGDIDCADSDCSSDPACGSSGGSTICTNTCTLYASDGDCDDGGPNHDYSLCDYGTDCDDCGVRDVCTDTCATANDNVCNDAGLGGDGTCDRGTDCADCGSY